MRFDESSLYRVESNLIGNRMCLFDIAKWKNGLAFKKIDFSESGVPVIKIAELNNGIGGTTAYTQGTYDSDVYLEKGDLLFSWSGNPKTSIDIYRFDLPNGWLNQHIFKVTPNEKIVNRDFFYHLMKFLKPYFTEIAINKQTTGLGHVTIADLKRVNIICPTLEIQNKISEILQSIDDKISTNTAINKNLEEQAQAIFKAWFVDFEPFGGEMPKTWKFGTIDDLGQDIICGKTPSTKKKEYYGGNVPFVTIPDMHNQIYITETERYLSSEGVNSQPTKTLPKNSICVSCIGTAGLVSLISTDSQTNQQINTIVPKDSISPYYVYFLMQSLSETIVRLGGSGSTIVNLNKGQFSKIEVIIPSSIVMKDFTEKLNPIFEMILSNQKGNTTLAALRDTLLPRLMSGEIDVGKVEV